MILTVVVSTWVSVSTYIRNGSKYSILKKLFIRGPCKAQSTSWKKYVLDICIFFYKQTVTRFWCSSNYFLNIFYYFLFENNSVKDPGPATQICKYRSIYGTVTGYGSGYAILDYLDLGTFRRKL
jgi:hypothetical protein